MFATKQEITAQVKKREGNTQKKKRRKSEKQKTQPNESNTLCFVLFILFLFCTPRKS
jgi:hypothetical protein